MGRLDFLDDELEALDRAHLLRRPRSDRDLPVDAVWLCSNDYLGLAARAARGEGAGGSGASALVWGYGEAHQQAEAALSRYAGVESCLLFSSGYAANVGTLSALAGSGDLIVSDALNHASIIDGCRLSGARVAVYPHLDVDAAGEALAGPGRRRFLVTESYFSMDGDAPDLVRLAEVVRGAGAALIVDEAHALGVLGPEGRGLCAAAGVVPDVLIGALGKAFGLAGAFVGGSPAVRTWLWNRARSFVFSTAVPPASAAAAAARVAEVQAADGPRARVGELSGTFRDLLEAETGIRPPGFGPIIPVAVGGAASTLAVAERLLQEGWVVQPMRPPTVPVGSSRLRLTVRATLTDTQVREAARALGSALRDLAGERAVGGGSVETRSWPHRPTPRLLQSTTPSLARLVAVVGTGTEVGKTHVASSLVEHLVAVGFRVAGRKPVESGVKGERGADQFALEVADSVLPDTPAPYRFSRPVSAHLAAREVGVEIDAGRAAAWSRSGQAELFVVESAGGLLSPLGPAATNLDLVVALRADAVLLVGADRLGVLHEVAACRLALEGRGLWERTVVALSAPALADASTGSNAAELVGLGIANPVVVWGRGGGERSDEAAATWAAIQSVAPLS